MYYNNHAFDIIACKPQIKILVIRLKEENFYLFPQEALLLF